MISKLAEHARHSRQRFNEWLRLPHQRSRFPMLAQLSITGTCCRPDCALIERDHALASRHNYHLPELSGIDRQELGLTSFIMPV